MINIKRGDEDLFKMYKEAKQNLLTSKHAPVYDLPPEAYAFGRTTPKSLLDTEFEFFGTDVVSNIIEDEDYLRDAGYVDSEDNLIPISYKLNKWGYREQKDMTDLENLEGIGDCILVTGNSGAFATAAHEDALPPASGRDSRCRRSDRGRLATTPRFRRAAPQRSRSRRRSHGTGDHRLG